MVLAKRNFGFRERSIDMLLQKLARKELWISAKRSFCYDFFHWITPIDTYTCIHIKNCRGARILLIDPYMNPYQVGNRPPVVG